LRQRRMQRQTTCGDQHRYRRNLRGLHWNLTLV
jgi:hypothetical protein